MQTMQDADYARTSIRKVWGLRFRDDNVGFGI